MSKLDEFFFDHLNSVTDVMIKAPEEGPLGLEGMNHIPLALEKDQMPLLKKLYLEYVFIGPELVSFLLGHSKTLEHLSLLNCYASINGLDDDGIHWKEFFDPLCDANPQNLRQLEISPSSLPLTKHDIYPQGRGPDEDPSENVLEARRSLQEDSSRRLFAHATLDDKYGMLFEGDEENLASLQRGEDQASYDRLLQIVAANEAKSFD